MNANPSFLENLFDADFRHFITLRLVKIVYIIAMIVLAIGSVIALVGGLLGAGGFFRGLFILIAVPVAAFIYLLLIRIWLELVVVVFRIGETSTEVRDLLAARREG